MLTDLKEKVVLITGSGKKSGIGYAMARKLAELGSHIIIADYGNAKDFHADTETGTMDEMQLIKKELAEKFKVKTLAVNVDVTNNDTIEKMMTSIRNSFERIDILCNNAGATFGVPNGIHTYDETAWMKTIDVNCTTKYCVGFSGYQKPSSR